MTLNNLSIDFTTQKYFVSTAQLAQASVTAQTDELTAEIL
jgi:hypothetical protein